MTRIDFTKPSRKLPIYKLMSDKKHGLTQSIETHNSRKSALENAKLYSKNGSGTPIKIYKWVGTYHGR